MCALGIFAGGGKVVNNASFDAGAEGVLMYLVGLGVILVLMKWQELGPVTALSWWWVLSPFFGAWLWWAWADSTGHTMRKAVEREHRIKQRRVHRTREAIRQSMRSHR